MPPLRQVDAMAVSLRKLFATLTGAAVLAVRLVFADSAVTEFGLELGKVCRL